MRDYAATRRETDAAMLGRPFPQLDHLTLHVARPPRRRRPRILRSLAIVVVALLAAFGCWDIAG